MHRIDEFLIQIDIEKELYYPQLKSVSVWLARLDDTYLKNLVNNHPEIVITEEIILEKEEDKILIIDKFFKLIKEHKLLFRDNNYYSTLTHNKLAIKIKPYIVNNNEERDARLLAISLATYCKIDSLSDDIFKILKDNSRITEPDYNNKNYYIRQLAAVYFHKFTYQGYEEKLFNLLEELNHNNDLDPDPDDEIKGILLLTLWPKVISTKDVLPFLQEQKNNSRYGSYEMFLDKFVKELQIKDYAITLEWINEKYNLSQEKYLGFDDLFEKIYAKIWSDFNKNSTYKYALMKLLVIVTNKQYHIFNHKLDTEYHNSTDNRLLIITELINHPDFYNNDCYMHLIVFKEDAEFIFTLLKEQQYVSSIDSILKLFNCLPYWYFSDFEEEIKTLNEQNSYLNNKFKTWLDKKAENDKDKEKAKVHDVEYQKLLNKKKEIDLENKKEWRNNPPEKRIDDCLNRIENGDIDYFYALTRQFPIEITEEKDYFGNIYYDEIIDQPGWKNANEPTKKRIINAAKVYLTKKGLKTNNEDYLDFYDTGSIKYYSHHAFYQALRLIYRKDKGFINTIPLKQWQEWAPIILIYKPEHKKEYESIHYDIINILIDKSYEAFEASIINFIAKGKSGIILNSTFLQNELHLKKYLNNIADNILKLIKNHEIHPKMFNNVGLLLANHKETMDYLKELINSNDPKAETVTLILLKAEKSDLWQFVWDFYESDTNKLKSLIEEISPYLGRMSNSNIYQSLKCSQLASLFIFLQRNYPEDPDRKQMIYTPDKFDYLSDAKSHIINEIKERKTKEAILALETIKQDLPNYEYITSHIVEAKQNYLAKSWKPFNPKKFLVLLSKLKDNSIEDDIKQKAYYISLENPANTAETNWIIAKNKIIREYKS